MFCIQCEQTMRTPIGDGCAYAQGMCGKTAETSDLQDLLVAALQGSAWALRARSLGFIDHEVDNFAPRAFFSTLTNVNFMRRRQWSITSSQLRQPAVPASVAVVKPGLWKGVTTPAASKH